MEPARARAARRQPDAEGERLTTRAKTDAFGDSLYTPEVDFAVVDRAAEVAAARGVPTAQVALAWLLHKPGVTAPIVGATKVEHLEDALAAEQLALERGRDRAARGAVRPARRSPATEARSVAAPRRGRPALNTFSRVGGWPSFVGRSHEEVIPNVCPVSESRANGRWGAEDEEAARPASSSTLGLTPFAQKINVDSTTYGPTAVHGVRKFQEAKKLQVDGCVGKNTWAALGVNEPVVGGPKPDQTGRVAHGGKVIIAPGANLPGQAIEAMTLEFVARMAASLGKPITVTTGTNHSKMSASGKVSDHFSGHACDIGMFANGGTDDSPVGDKIMEAACLLAGDSKEGASAKARGGGLFTFNTTISGSSASGRPTKEVTTTTTSTWGSAPRDAAA